MARSIEDAYPYFARWVKTHGWVEIGYDDSGYEFSFVRALDPGGMVWEGAMSYPTVDAALQALNEALHTWMHEEMGEP